VLPGILPVISPVLVGLLFRYFPNPAPVVEAAAGQVPGSVSSPASVAAMVTPVGAASVAAFLMVGTITGILVALMMNNGGGAWDNAKKFIETGAHGGKGSESHKASVVGDTVGDPFKDTAGPSLHVLIKLLSTITLVAVPLFL
jgi:K(+)-stimulated pyrophosphate-energized sodium pump